MTYSFDTSVFIEMKFKYPKEKNKKLWQIISDRLKTHKILVSKEVKIEIHQITDSLDSWLGQFPRSIIDSTTEIQREVTKIENRYTEMIDPQSTHHSADLYVIALAKVFNAIVVSQEKIKGARRAIPYICQKEQIECKDLVTFLVEEGFNT